MGEALGYTGFFACVVERFGPQEPQAKELFRSIEIGSEVLAHTPFALADFGHRPEGIEDVDVPVSLIAIGTRRMQNDQVW